MIYIITGSINSKKSSNKFYNELKQSDIIKFINTDSVYFDDNVHDFYMETDEVSSKDVEEIETWFDDNDNIVKINMEIRKSIKENVNSNIKYNLMHIICNEDLPDVTITSGNDYTKASYSKILEYLKYN